MSARRKQPPAAVEPLEFAALAIEDIGMDPASRRRTGVDGD